MILCVKKKKKNQIKPLTEAYGWAKNKKIKLRIAKENRVESKFWLLKKKERSIELTLHYLRWIF